jgi:hypothetical protein
LGGFGRKYRLDPPLIVIAGWTSPAGNDDESVGGVSSTSLDELPPSTAGMAFGSEVGGHAAQSVGQSTGRQRGRSR